MKLAVVVTLLLLSYLVPAAGHAAVPGLPPSGKVMLGVGGATPGQFRSLTGQRHAIHHTFMNWEQGISWGGGFERYLSDAERGNYRSMFHIGTKAFGGERIAPGEIARGAGDDYLVAVSRIINQSRQVTYIRPMAEMNGHWNVYSAFNTNGTRRDADHSTRSYRKAFRRIALIMRGGNVRVIDSKLRASGMPVLRTDDESLPRSNKLALVWNPQGEGSPNVRGNQPRDYYPGDGYVDFVANDLYSINFRPYWAANERLYNSFPNKPFMMAEWAPWGTDDPKYVTDMFNWVRSHGRVKALVYFDGSSSNLFRLSRKPRSLAKYRSHAKLARYRCGSCGAF